MDSTDDRITNAKVVPAMTKARGSQSFCVGPTNSALLHKPIAGAVRSRPKLQALVYDILSSTTAVFSYAIGSRKLSANEQFFLLVLKQ